jgi:phosphoglycerol transferase
VLGDHLAMPNPVQEQLQQAGSSRRIFNLFVADRYPHPTRAEVLPFDMFPTLVEMLGMEVAGHRLGLGYSAVAEVEAPPFDEEADDGSLATLRGSGAYDALWEAPAVSSADTDPSD